MKLKAEYDLLIVGAGIYGAWLAYDASLRGLKVLIIDKSDIANATSSASSKLIHGGLRYLEQFNFSLVKKSVKERQNLFTIAPHRVKPLKFAIPVYKGSRISSWKYKLGLSIYDFFANIKNKNFKHSSINKADFKEQYPYLKSEGFKKGFSYLDAGTDDFRYTLEIIDGAVKAGAHLETYCELLRYEGKKAIIKNQSKQTEVSFKYAINATGQWTDSLFKTEMCRLSKGVHIILPSIGLSSALLLLSPLDERVFFAIPWYGRTMIGTTDTDFKEDINSVAPNEQDCDYLLQSFNHFLNTPFAVNDIISSFAGLRVLKNDNGHPSSITRDWQWQEIDTDNFVSLGGKLTSSREDSAKLIDLICNRMGISKKCTSHSMPFPWAPENYESWKIQISHKLHSCGIDSEKAEMLISRHGKRTEEIVQLIDHDKSLSQEFSQGLPFTIAEFQYVLDKEYVYNFEDLIRRRFPLVLLKKAEPSELDKIKNLANEYLKSINKKELG